MTHPDYGGGRYYLALGVNAETGHIGPVGAGETRAECLQDATERIGKEDAEHAPIVEVWSELYDEARAKLALWDALIRAGTLIGEDLAGRSMRGLVDA